MSLPSDKVDCPSISWPVILKDIGVSNDVAVAISKLELTKCRAMESRQLILTLCEAAPGLPGDIAYKIFDRISKAGHFFIVQLEKVLVYPTKKEGLAKIEELKTSRNNHYFEGTFSRIVEGCFIFEFETTLPASSATSSCFGVSVINCDADSIAPACDMIFDFRVDICYISETEHNMAMAVTKANAKAKELAKTTDVLFRILDDNLDDENARKRIKLDFESRIKNDIEDPSEGPLESIDPKTYKAKLYKADEISKTLHIFKQLEVFARKYPILDVYENKSAILYNPQRKFSKYSKSRPDITTVINDICIFNRETRESVMVMSDAEVDAEGDVETIDEDVTKKMNAMSLDPFGQLLAGMEGLYADLLFDQLTSVSNPDSLFPADTVVMYGMCILCETDSCILVKAELNIGVKTLVYKSRIL